MIALAETDTYASIFLVGPATEFNLADQGIGAQARTFLSKRRRLTKERNNQS